MSASQPNLIYAGGADPDRKFTLHLPHYIQHYYGQRLEKLSQRAYKNLNVQRNQILLNKSHLMLINNKAGQNLLWFKLALCSSTTSGKTDRTRS